MARPTGTVTFLFTDLESSTRLWEEHPEAMREALARHDELLNAAIAEHDGYVFGSGGDGLYAAFGSAADAVAAAAEGQRRLRREPWPREVHLTARMGIHTGVAQERDGDYFGPAVNRTARICAAGHGGQVLVSDVAAALLDDPWELADLGSHDLRGVTAPTHLWQVVIEGDRDDYPPLRGTERPRHNLPVVRTGFHGREEEIEELVDRLGAHRIVTLTGPGGVGKTRLALEVAERVLERFEAVLFVDLSPAEAPDAVPEAVLTAASLPADVAPDAQVDRLVRAWRHRRVLLVLDNCEHVLDSAADVVDRVTAGCAGVVVLATSREALAVGGEQVHPVRSLAPRDAARLFIERATEIRPDLALDSTGQQIVERICQRLDGLPLALELAGSRVAHLGLAELEDHLDDRFRLLTGSRRRALRRQQTLQATVDWSYDLLDDDERSLLRASAVFVASFDLDALAAVWGASQLETLDRLGSLVDKSLVSVVHDEAATVRYRLLETIRLYAQDRLVAAGEAPARRQALADHVLAGARAHPPRIVNLEPWGLWTSGRRMQGFENHLAALEWFDAQGDLVSLGQVASRMTTVLEYSWFLDLSWAYLGRDDVVDALVDPAERALYLTASAANANYLGRYREQLRHAEAAVDVAKDPVTRSAAAQWLAVAYMVFDPDRVAEAVDRGLRDLPDDADAARLMLTAARGSGLAAQGRLTEAAEALAAVRTPRDAFPTTELMLVRHLLGEDPFADLPPAEGGETDLPFAYRVDLAHALTAAAAGETGRAAAALERAGDAIRDYPSRLLHHDVLVGCAALAYSQGEIERASRLLAALGGQLRSPASYAVYLHYRDLVRDRLSREERRAIVAQAAGLDPLDVLEAELERLADAADAAAV